MISRIGTFTNTSGLVSASLQVQAQLADQEQQQASGVRSATYGGLGGDAGQLLNISGQSARLKAETAAATTAGNVVQAAYTATGNIADLATTIRTQLSAALNGTTASSSANPINAASVSGWMASLQTDLNTQVGGQYVFAGQAANQPPVDYSNPNYDPSGNPATPDTTYYNGTSAPRTLTAVDGTTLQVSTTADQPGFEELSRALKLVSAYPSDTAVLQHAYDLVGQAVNDIAQTQSALSQQASALDDLSSHDTAMTTTLDNISGTINGANLTTATVLITQYQTQLQALFGSIGQLSQVSLLKYLNF